MQVLKIIVEFFILICIIAFFAFVFYPEDTLLFKEALTLLSIVMGFSITALSLIANSNFSKELYKQESSNDNSKTLLHEFVEKFKSSIVLFISTILVILIYTLLEEKIRYTYNLGEFTFNLKGLLFGVVFYLILRSVYSFFSLTKMFSKFVIQSAKKK